MTQVYVVGIAGERVPADLVAPFACCDREWFVPIADVVRAAAGSAPLVSPCCGTRFGVRDLGAVGFFSRAEWVAAPDDQPPERFHIGYAFRDPSGPKLVREFPR